MVMLGIIDDAKKNYDVSEASTTKVPTMEEEEDSIEANGTIFLSCTLLDYQIPRSTYPGYYL
jgi:hypothetical protein